MNMTTIKLLSGRLWSHVWSLVAGCAVAMAVLAAKALASRPQLAMLGQQQQKISVVQERLINEYGYDEHSAKEALNYVTTLLAAGLQVTHLVEWGPSDDDLMAHPDWDVERDRCPFMFLGATKPG